MSRRVSEPSPVQVYLDRGEHERLERLAHQLDTSKSDILRRGIHALERQITDPESHPALRLIGISAGEPVVPLGYDPAVEHDRFLAESEETTRPPREKGRKQQGGR